MGGGGAVDEYEWAIIAQGCCIKKRSLVGKEVKGPAWLVRTLRESEFQIENPEWGFVCLYLYLICFNCLFVCLLF